MVSTIHNRLAVPLTLRASPYRYGHGPFGPRLSIAEFLLEAL